MILIDSSYWVHYFRRRGDEAIRDRVSELVGAGNAAWCAAIRLELWNGVASDLDRAILQEYEDWMPDLEISSLVWDEACQLASRCRKAGKTAPPTDVLIAACARHHRVELERADAHFDFLLTL